MDAQKDTKITMAELDRVFADDVHFPVPIEFTIGGVACAVKLDIRYGGASLRTALAQSTRMTKTDFGNTNRPTANDDDAKRAVKAARIEGWSKHGTLVPINVAVKGAVNMTPEELISVMDEDQLTALMDFAKQRMANIKKSK
jgi:hypothetical protein